MKLNGCGAALGMLATGALVLSGCGSDTASKASSPVSDCGGVETLKASGSTAQRNAMARFVKAFTRECSDQAVDYTPNGSGAGIREFIDGQTDFAGSDVALSADEYTQAEQRCGSPAWNLPVVFGPIALAYNIAGVDHLILDGPTAARIFNGTITTWDDPAVKALNPGAALPAAPIHVVFRNDESGTTDNFQQYLDGASDGAWGKGTGRTFNGGVGQGTKGNEGTAEAVSATEGSITYTEWSFTQVKNLHTAQIITSAGPDPVAISVATVATTISGATFTGQGNDLVLDTASFSKPSQVGAYPIVLATYEVVCSKYPDAEVGTAVRMFLKSTIGPGQFDLDQIGYVPIPDAFRPHLVTAVDAIG
ncbi:phosphate ABC transporter substrate-binding protein PstS [[Mycobacterium] nativiensis]|uniref:Phosphate-binding protein n=1 Tax=[Mycobacterium] nativiensis TaxID=2855503 RepID=A0ABU5XQK1_9MYCO|nr:phosphate ABC transporter substrate-binding protein PstS [Mycolicibacter sp. MYC340]MEB3030198.1 phosphate ABC transporter substrate-binding protein PstS [Mycolicibacter sp. MYC340]